MREITVPSGAQVKIGIAGWDDVMTLKGAILAEAARADIKITMDMAADFDIGQIAKMAMLVDSSKTVYDALFKCLGKSTYNGQSITKATFEPVEARRDYYKIVIEFMKDNLGPFFEEILSGLKPLLAELPKSPQNPPKSK